MQKPIKFQAPGTTFQMGIHHVSYVASDYAGNRAYCYFTIKIGGTQRNTLDVNSVINSQKTVLLCPRGVRYLSNALDYYKVTKNGITCY